MVSQSTDKNLTLSLEISANVKPLHGLANISAGVV